MGNEGSRWGIPSLFEGVVYRSRTEAKWAVVFRELALPFDPEPQGYDSSWGDSYLPDFRVQAANGILWVEVKPTIRADPAGIQRWRHFAADRPDPLNSRAVLLIGAPRIDNETIVIGGDENAADPAKGPWEDGSQIWRPCTSGLHFDLAYPGNFRAKFAEDGCPDDFGAATAGEDRLEAAIAVATSYNFKRPMPPGTAA